MSPRCGVLGRVDNRFVANWHTGKAQDALGVVLSEQPGALTFKRLHDGRVRHGVERLRGVQCRPGTRPRDARQRLQSSVEVTQYRDASLTHAPCGLSDAVSAANYRHDGLAYPLARIHYLIGNPL